MKSNIYLDGDYSRKNPSFHTEDSSWKAGQILRIIKKHHLQARSFCEIGCGGGEILSQLQRHMPEETTFYGYDISPQAIEICRQRENKRLLFFREDLLLKDMEPYDILLCADVFEHVEDYMGFLRRLKAKAKYKIFHIPLDISVQMVLLGSPFELVRTEVGHLHYFTKETALMTLEDTGYNVVDYFYTPSRVDNPKNLKAKFARYPRMILFALNPDLAVRILGGYSLLVLTE